jgi:hypothetical protein
MNTILGNIFRPVVTLLSSRTGRFVFLICVLFIIALSEFFYLGLARRTFLFYTVGEGNIVVEDRMLKHAKSRESDIIRYVEETLLGPAAPNLLPLFPRGTKLKSLLYREGVVYADFSSDAALPPIEGGVTLDNFKTFYASILRNFSYVKDVRFFIEGNAVFVDEFWYVRRGLSGT